MRMIRTFVAVDLPGETRATIARGLAPLIPAFPSVRWVEPENMHLTLRFIGDTPEDRIEPLARLLGEMATGGKPFRMSLRDRGAFPPRGRPRVFFLAVDEGRRELEALAADVERVVTSAGFPPETRVFHPHLTVGRIADRRPPPSAEAWIGGGGEEGQSRLEVKEFDLIRSELGPGGPRYTKLSRFPLGGPAN